MLAHNFILVIKLLYLLEKLLRIVWKFKSCRKVFHGERAYVLFDNWCLKAFWKYFISISHLYKFEFLNIWLYFCNFQILNFYFRKRVKKVGRSSLIEFIIFVFLYFSKRYWSSCHQIVTLRIFILHFSKGSIDCNQVN